MLNWMSRRHVLGVVASAFGLGAGLREGRAADVSPQAVCSWRFVESRCDGDTTWEMWRYTCCDLSGCSTVREEWRPKGSC